MEKIEGREILKKFNENMEINFKITPKEGTLFEYSPCETEIIKYKFEKGKWKYKNFIGQLKEVAENKQQFLTEEYNRSLKFKQN